MAIRFSIVALIFIVIAVGLKIWRNKDEAVEVTDHSNKTILKTALIGVLINSTYLGGTFFAMANGLGAALAASIASTHPLLTTTLTFFYLMRNHDLFSGLDFLSALWAL